ncbi:MAG: acyl-CoA synthetase [Desulfobacterales bacterium]|nr:acyl-CoA synthetase [Desulfobacterales bacterium]
MVEPSMDLEEYLPPKELWPDLVVPEEFKDLPDQFNLTEYLLENHLREGRADQTVIYFEDEKITYGEIARNVNSLGKSFIDLGIAPRDRIGVRMTNRPQAIIANLAILKIGAIPVPVPPLWSAKEIVYVTEDALLRAMVVDRFLLGAVRQAEKLLTSDMLIIVVDDNSANDMPLGDRHYAFSDLLARESENFASFKLKQNDIAVLLYTSGTTGPPKGCAQTTSGVFISSSLVAKNIYGLHEGGILGGPAPISFAAGFGTFVFIPLISRGAISLLPKFSPEGLLKNIARHKVTVLTGIPTAYRKMLGSKALDTCDLSSLRLCTVGGDALDDATLETWKAKTGLPVWLNYGITETFHVLLSTRIGKILGGNSIGKPVPGYEARVLDGDGHPCASGVMGTLAVRGPTGTIYWNPRRNGGRLMKSQQMIVKNGWNMVDDYVVQDDTANFRYVCRQDDMIKSSGYRLGPEEIESVILEHPSVQEAVVIGVPDSIRGQAIKAFVVLKKGVIRRPGLEGEIKEFCRDHIALYKLPHIFEFVLDLPKTAMGKIIRKHLRAS